MNQRNQHETRTVEGGCGGRVLIIMRQSSWDKNATNKEYFSYLNRDSLIQ